MSRVSETRGRREGERPGRSLTRSLSRLALLAIGAGRACQQAYHLLGLDHQSKTIKSAAPRATLTHLSCPPNFPRVSITRYTHAKHEQILNFLLFQLN